MLFVILIPVDDWMSREEAWQPDNGYVAGTGERRDELFILG